MIYNHLSSIYLIHHQQTLAKKKADRKIQEEIIKKQAEMKIAAEASAAAQPVVDE